MHRSLGTHVFGEKQYQVSVTKSDGCFINFHINIVPNVALDQKRITKRKAIKSLSCCLSDIADAIVLHDIPLDSSPRDFFSAQNSTLKVTKVPKRS